MTVSIYCTNLQNLGTYTNKLIKKKENDFCIEFQYKHVFSLRRNPGFYVLGPRTNTYK